MIVKSVLITILIFYASCAFPGKQLIARSSEIQRNSMLLKASILSEFPASTGWFPVSDIRNDSLRIFLQSLKVSQISITYNNFGSLSVGKPSNEMAIDSAITFNWTKRMDGGMDGKIWYHSIHYFFGEIKPALQEIKKGDYRNVRINDSIWVHKRVDDIIVVH